jgi:hypothetical protein
MKKLSGRERLYIGVFGVALLWGGWNYRHLFSSQTATPTVMRPQAAVAVEARPEAALPPRARLVAKTDSGTVVQPVPPWSADPFYRSWRNADRAAVSDPKATRPTTPLSVTAIVVRPQARYAVINGKIIREGQSIAGRKVLKIEESGVTVIENGVEVTLNL